MTVILDPGTGATPPQAESYNATSRPWRTSAGLWKADYTTAEAARVAAVAAIAAGAPAALTNLSAAGSLSNTPASTTICSVTLTRAGYWSISFRGTGTTTGDTNAQTHQLTVSGVGVVDSGSSNVSGNNDIQFTIGMYYLNSLANGTVVSVQATTQFNAGGASSMSGTLHCDFIPTPGAPH